MIYIDFKKKAFDFHNKIVKDIFNNIITKKYIERGDRTHRNKVYINTDFLDFLNENKDELIGGLPTKLFNLHEEFKKLTLNNDENKNIKSFLLETGYKNFQKKHSKDFLNFIGIDTCIYCNKNYTLNISKSHARAELDHWYPKNEFPLLALSFHNLIPSCHSCNHIKGKAGDWSKALEKFVHPYFKEADEGFSFDFFYNQKLDSLKIEAKAYKKSIKTGETLEFNKIKEKYNANAEKELRDLLDLRYKYSSNYIKILSESAFMGLRISKDEIYRLVFGIEIEEENYHKRPFSKFKKDIIDKILLIDDIGYKRKT
ncbi:MULTISPECIES: hypothetical protein [unclassified Chryseobacterium]|uniref:hypothetical protein n=1 Tax=unclassified Chryseobacterium TaxID=2593645 RepID=UPI001AE8AE08|nr:MULTISPECIES: hypothetical protein [unclassified Chryseobacterium]MBP1163738.1 hypothetical protein [Chryseobacterium sp. PvR013]MDR4894104.1 hypothetical protein [Chryseobacterium sp. CFS7]